MSIANVQDVLYIVASLCLIWITVFLCWALFEAGRLLHQANKMVTDTREKITRVERVLTTVGDKIGSASSYLGLIAEGGKQVMSWMKNREDDDDDVILVKKSKSKRKSREDEE